MSLVQQHGGFVPSESLEKSSELGNLETNMAVIHLTTFELSANKKKRTLLREEIHRSLLYAKSCVLTFKANPKP